jgi:hypothetical protein
LDDLNQNHDDRNHQEDVNESAHGVGTDEAEKPKDDQDDGNRVEHLDFPYPITGRIDVFTDLDHRLRSRPAAN